MGVLFLSSLFFILLLGIYGKSCVVPISLLSFCVSWNHNRVNGFAILGNLRGRPPIKQGHLVWKPHFSEDTQRSHNFPRFKTKGLLQTNSRKVLQYAYGTGAGGGYILFVILIYILHMFVMLNPVEGILLFEGLNICSIRVTIQVVSNLQLTSKQKFCFNMRPMY